MAMKKRIYGKKYYNFGGAAGAPGGLLASAGVDMTKFGGTNATTPTMSTPATTTPTTTTPTASDDTGEAQLISQGITAAADTIKAFAPNKQTNRVDPKKDLAGYYNQLADEKDAKNDKMLSAGLGIAGGIAGAFLGNPMLGYQVGKGAGDVVGNFTSEGGPINTKKTKFGKNIYKFFGPTHSNNPYTGIPFGDNNYAEGGEFLIKQSDEEGYVLPHTSDGTYSMMYDKKNTYAQAFNKKMNNLYKLGRDNDPISNRTSDKISKQFIDKHEKQLEENQLSEGGIYIKPSKRGSFTRWAKSHNMGVQEAANAVMANTDEYSSAIVKKANFAKNASKWHSKGGKYFVIGGGTDKDEYINGVKQDYREGNEISLINPDVANITSRFETTSPYYTGNFSADSPEAKFNINQDKVYVDNRQVENPVTPTVQEVFKSGNRKDNNNPPPPPPPSNPPKDNSKLLAGIGAGLQGLAGLHQLFKGLRGGDVVDEVPVKAARINPKRGLALATKNLMRTAAGSRYGSANAKTHAEKLAMDSAINAGLYDAIGNTTLNAYLQPEQFNKQMQQQANLANQQMKMTVNDWRQREKDAAATAVTEGLGRTGSGIAGGIKDQMAYKAQDKYIEQMENLLNKYSSHFNADGTVKTAAMGGRIKYNFKKKNC